jgi:hypothetical protein
MTEKICLGLFTEPSRLTSRLIYYTVGKLRAGGDQIARAVYREAMQELTRFIEPTYLVYAGFAGVFLGLLFLLLYLYHRITWVIRVISGKKTISPGLVSSLGRLVMIFLWTSIFGMCLFFGFFLRSYHAFTIERPVAEILSEPLGAARANRITVIRFDPPASQEFLILGDQWMIEGDILKWDDWLNFLGLETRYRLTRVRGRYVSTHQEALEKPTVYSLVRDEHHFLWKYLYEYGHRLPFVSTVYGGAVFQVAKGSHRFLLYVGPSGFIVRGKPGHLTS